MHPSKPDLHAAHHTASENNESKEIHAQAKSSKATNLIATPPNTRINLNNASKK